MGGWLSSDPDNERSTVAQPVPVLPYAIRQFEVDVLVPIHILGIDASFTVSAQAMVTTVIVITLLCVFGLRPRQSVPRRLQCGVEWVHDFVVRTVTKNGGPEAAVAVPLLLTIFVFILIGGFIGLTPIKFTFTSQLVVTLSLALVVFCYAVGLGLARHGLGMLRIFVPPGAPVYVAPVIFVIELISFLFRPVTLAVRLFANIVAGHIMLKLFADGCVMILDQAEPLALPTLILPLTMMIVLYAFEYLVMLIQAYIFIMLSATYIGEAARGPHAH